MKPRDIEAQYLRAIKKALPCDSAQKKRYIAGLRDSIQPYLSEHPDATLEDLYSAFGTPDSIAENYINNADVKDITKKISKKKLAVVGLVLLTVLAVVGIGIGVRISNDVHDIKDGYFVDEVDVHPENADSYPSDFMSY